MKTALASVVAAGGASACCIGPVVFVLSGAGTFGTSLAVLEPASDILSESLKEDTCGRFWSLQPSS